MQARWPAYRSRQREGVVALENGRSSLSVRPLPFAPSLLFVIEIGVVIIVGVVRVQGAGLVRIIRARVARRLAARAAAALPLHVALRVVAGLAGHGLMADRVDVFVINLRPLRLEVGLRARKLSLSAGRVDVGHTGYGSGVTELSG